MSLRLEMLQVARLAPQLLGDSTGLVERFILAQQSPEGGFCDRNRRADLYYTAFALDCLTALQATIPENVERWLSKYDDGRDLDFVHLCCLARCWSAVDGKSCHFLELGERIAQSLGRFRSNNGGYHNLPGNATGSAYGAFLALGAFQDLGLPVTNSDELAKSLESLRCQDGGWSNEFAQKESSTNSTAAAVSVLRNLQGSVEAAETVGRWLLQQAHTGGGFRAAPRAPIPDLLSTATALHALAGLQVDFSGVKESTLDFIDSLWTNEGSFFGHWGEDVLDCEYTFYGLLALGHLSY